MASRSLWLSCFLVTCVGVMSQTCEPFAGSPDYCEGYVTSTVYVPPGVTQADLSATLLQALPARILGLIPPNCLPFTLSMSCGRAFRSCNDSNAAIPPVPLCSATCLEFNKNQTDCPGEKDPFNPAANLFSDSIDCSNMMKVVPKPPSVTSCPTYFVVKKDGGCVPGHIKNIFRYILPLSMAIELILVFTWLVVWDPARPLYVAFFMLSLFAQHLGLFIGRWMRFDEWQCVDATHPRTQAHTGCAIQGWLGIMGTHAGAMWVGVLLYHLVSSVTQQKYEASVKPLTTFGRYQIFGSGKLIPIEPKYVYHLLVWGVSGVLTLVPFALDSINLQVAYLCYPDGRMNDLVYLYGLIHLPLTIFLTIEIGLIILLFYKIFTLAGLAGLRSQGRLTALCVYYVAATTYLMINSWVTFGKRHRTRADVEKYIVCITTNFQNGVVPDTTGCGPGPHWNNTPEFIGEVLVSLYGVVIGLILLDPHFLRVWKSWLTCRFDLGQSDSRHSAGSRLSTSGAQTSSRERPGL